MTLAGYGECSVFLIWYHKDYYGNSKNKESREKKQNARFLKRQEI